MRKGIFVFYVRCLVLRGKSTACGPGGFYRLPIGSLCGFADCTVKTTRTAGQFSKLYAVMRFQICALRLLETAGYRIMNGVSFLIAQFGPHFCGP